MEVEEKGIKMSRQIRMSPTVSGEKMVDVSNMFRDGNVEVILDQKVLQIAVEMYLNSVLKIPYKINSFIPNWSVGAGYGVKVTLGNPSSES